MVHGKKHSGFVLLMVLVVLVIAGTILAASARRTGLMAIEAGNQEEELQVRWGSVSCKDFCLPRADDILGDKDASDKSPAVLVAKSIKIGRVNFQLIVCDEQAKANVNTLARRRGPEGMAAAVRALQANAQGALNLELRPAPTSNPIERRYSSFDQLFRFDHPSQLVLPKTPERSTISRLTCWGSGLVNFKKASPSVLHEVAEGILTETQLAELVKYRDRSPDCTLGEAIKELKFSTDQAQRVRETLTDVSTCHSVWVIAQGQTRQWYRLYGQSGFGESGRWVLAW